MIEVMTNKEAVSRLRRYVNALSYKDSIDNFLRMSTEATASGPCSCLAVFL